LGGDATGWRLERNRLPTYNSDATLGPRLDG
jgi:hypothetical protein